MRIKMVWYQEPNMPASQNIGCERIKIFSNLVGDFVWADYVAEEGEPTVEDVDALIAIARA